MVALVNVPHTSGKSGSNKPELLGGNGKEEDAKLKIISSISEFLGREREATCCLEHIRGPALKGRLRCDVLAKAVVGTNPDQTHPL